jgi:hypothetical protein
MCQLYTKVIETFVDRDDHLVYRAVSFSPSDARKTEPIDAAAGVRVCTLVFACVSALSNTSSKATMCCATRVRHACGRANGG